MEGIMMVGPKRTTAAFCDSEGNITTEDLHVDRLTKKYPILGKPFIRGIFALVDTFRLGYKAISLSADKLTDMGEEELTGFDKWLEDHFGDKITGINLLEGAVGEGIAGWRSIFEGVLRIAIFLGYVLCVSLVPDIKRVFQYHGAEHKTIFCYEEDLPLTVENVRPQKRFHPRCGTSFMILMLLLGVIAGFFIPFANPIIRTIVKLLCIPFIVNIG